MGEFDGGPEPWIKEFSLLTSWVKSPSRDRSPDGESASFSGEWEVALSSASFADN